MKILVIGAAGKTGRLVVERAVAAGHQVTALVRAGAGDFKRPEVRVVEGDATERATMDEAVRGQDAVVNTIGGKTPYMATRLEASVASTVIECMKQNGVRRLVVTSMAGEGDSKVNTSLYNRLLLPTFLRGADKDKAEMESAVESSGLDWVILRPAILSDAAAKGEVRVFDARTGDKAHKLTRSDLASFMVAQLSNNEHLHKAVTIANS
jgi:putative NADH-flavin reductase